MGISVSASGCFTVLLLSVSGCASRNVYNVTGADYSELVDYVDNGHPVLVWETMWMSKPHIAAEWNVDGETIAAPAVRFPLP